MDAWFSPLPLLTPGNDGGRSRKSLSRAFAAGDLVRLRHGFYAETDAWRGSTSAQRFATIVKAVAGRLHEPVFTGTTALMLQGVPLVETPATVDVITSTASRAGLQTMTPGYHEAHLRGGDALPYIHRTRNVYRETLLGLDTPQCPSLHTSVRCEALRGHLSDTLATVDFSEALVITDSLLSGRNTAGIVYSSSEVAALLGPEAPSIGGEVPSTVASSAQRVLHHASHLSESAEESLSRARMIELGFAIPQLQRRLTGADGKDYRVDFYWKELGLIGESDGWGKYSADGTDPAESLREEKRREDALRERGYRFIRWDWADAVDPQRFAELLVRNGVPRRRRASIRWTA